LFGREAMKKLRDARVTIVGLGAVGSYATEALARAGVGHLRLVDFDEVRESNINRQLFALGSTLGRPKVDVARERVLDINPSCEVETLRLFVDGESAGSILAPPADVVIDAIDSVASKIELLAAAAGASVFTISSMGAATRTDPGAIRVADIAETDMCPLARHVRKRLKKRGVEKGILCVYSVEPAHEKDAVGEPEEETHPRGRPRRPLGSFSCLTGIFGLTVAREAIMRLIGQTAERS
jgi:tRNA A37 threonylcarbamoyladenosine dehydratase